MSYTHSIKLLQLAEIIDKLGVNERYKAEASASALIKPGKNPKITIDNLLVFLPYHNMVEKNAMLYFLKNYRYN